MKNFSTSPSTNPANSTAIAATLASYADANSSTCSKSIDLELGKKHPLLIVHGITKNGIKIGDNQ